MIFIPKPVGAGKKHFGCLLPVPLIDKISRVAADNDISKSYCVEFLLEKALEGEDTSWDATTQRDGFVDAVEPSTSDAAAKKTMPRADDTTQPIRSQSWGPKDLILMCLPTKEEAEAIASDPHLKVGAWGTSKWVQDENGLSQATVSKCLDDLMEEGSVASIRTHQATRTGKSRTWIYYRVYE